MKKIDLGNGIEPWFTSCGPQTRSISVTWELIRKADTHPPPLHPPRPAASESLGWAPSSVLIGLSSDKHPNLRTPGIENDQVGRTVS